MILGLYICNYYLDYRFEGWSALLVATAFAIASGLWLDLIGRKRLSEFEAFGCEVAIAVTAAAVIVIPPLLDGRANSVGSVSLLGMGLVASAALAVLARFPRRRTALPTAVALSQLVFVALLALFASGRRPEFADWYRTVSLVAAPVAGAAGAALVYLSRMPWRRHGAISTGSATRIGLGLVVTWAAVHLGIGPESEAAPAQALVWAAVWILLVPACELARLTGLSIWHLVACDSRPSGGRGSLRSSSPMVLACAFAAAAFGVSLYALQVRLEWLAIWIAPASLGYVFVPMLVQARRDAEPERAMDLHG